MNLDAGWLHSLKVVAVAVVAQQSNTPSTCSGQTSLSKKTAAFFLAVFLLLLIFLPLTAKISQNQSMKLFDSFYRAGSLVFGGGHVVLPLL